MISPAIKIAIAGRSEIFGFHLHPQTVCAPAFFQPSETVSFHRPEDRENMRVFQVLPGTLLKAVWFSRTANSQIPGAMLWGLRLLLMSLVTRRFWVVGFTIVCWG